MEDGAILLCPGRSLVKSREDTCIIVISILNVFDAGKLSIQLFNLAISPTQGKSETGGDIDNFWTVGGYH